ncbi:hypothetical protein K8S19_02505 [bacterium]|nr:hypothetical protein [bacterium]
MRACLSWGDEKAFLRFNESETSRKLYAKLPLTAVAQTWGEEVYFNVPVHTELEPDACQVVEAGTLCFWVEGSSVAIPFGTTPASRNQECRLVTLVNIIGKVEGDPSHLGMIRAGEKITLFVV